MSFTADTALEALREAVKEALELHAKLGIPSVYMKDGKLCWLMPDGTETFYDPRKKEKE